MKKRDIKDQPFAWQEKHILRLIKSSFKGSELSRYLLLYNTLTWLHSDFNGKPIKYFTKIINTYSGLSPRFIPEGIKVLSALDIVQLRGVKKGNCFVTKELLFTPENVSQDAVSLMELEGNNCIDSTIVENSPLIEHNLKDVSKDTVAVSPKTGKKSKRKFSDSVRMDNAAVSNFLTGSSQESQIFDKVVSLVKEANSKCKRTPAFSTPQSPDTKYLKTLMKQIELLQAGKFVSAHTWMPFFKREKFLGEKLKGASDIEVWDMIEFSMMKYIRVRNGTKYLFYGHRNTKITLADFMYISYQALRPPEPGAHTPDGYSAFWQYLLPLKRSLASTDEFEEKIQELYKKSSTVLGKEIYNHYKTLDMSEKIRFCKSIIAMGNYFKKNKKALIANNSSAVIVLRNRKALFEYYVKWIHKSGFEHIPGVYPGNEGRWIDFVNWLKKNYGVDLEAIHKPKPKKKKEVWVEPEISEQEAYDRSILGVLYDVLDPEERLQKLKIWFRAQHEEKMESV